MGRGVQGNGRQVRLVVVLKCGVGIGVIMCGVLQCYVVLRVVWCGVVWCGVVWCVENDGPVTKRSKSSSLRIEWRLYQCMMTS